MGLAALAPMPFFGIRPAFARSGKSRQGLSGQVPAAFASPKRVNAGLLNIAYVEAGPSDGPIVILLHGWPYDVHSFADATAILAGTGYRVLVPYLRGYGPTRFLSSDTVRNGQQATFGVDVIAFMDALKIDKAILGGFDWGARAANVVALIWPERCKALVSVSGYDVEDREADKLPQSPEDERRWWYEHYFMTERGRAGYEKYRKDFSRLIWTLASPKWTFDEVTFARSALAFDNPDHVEIVIHNYRWRLGLAEGEAKYDHIERKLAGSPRIGVPTVTLEGDANGAPHLPPGAYRDKFTGKYRHIQLKGGIGHNLPQEAPREFASAIVEAFRFS
jgi:pimeloyl-ACP methyl ester carboxylesterase